MATIGMVGWHGLRPLVPGAPPTPPTRVAAGGGVAAGRLGDLLAVRGGGAPASEIELKGLAGGAEVASATPERQRRIDTLIASIDAAASEVAVRRGFEQIAVTEVSADVASFEIADADLAPGDSEDVEILVRQSAQRAGLFLSMGAGTLDLGTGSSFVLEIGGAGGAFEVVLSSSQSLATVAAAIDAHAPETGVRATVSGTGVSLRATGYGADEFVSVKVLDDGGIGTADNIGIYRMEDDDANAADPYKDNNFHNADIIDAGQDVTAVVNGVNVIGAGTSLAFSTPKVTGTVELGVGALSDPNSANAEHPGRLHALTVSVLESADGAGEMAHGPGAWPDELADGAALRSRVDAGLGFLGMLREAGSRRLPGASASWLDGASRREAGGIDEAEAGRLAAEAREALLGGGRPVIAGISASRVLGLLGVGGV